MAIGTISNGESGSSVRTKLNSAIAQLNGSVIGTDVQAYDVDTAKLDTAQDWTAIQDFTAGLTGGADSTTLSTDATITLDGKAIRSRAAPIAMACHARLPAKAMFT